MLRHRWLDLDRRRQNLLNAGGNAGDLRYYVKAMIDTLAEELKPRPEGNHYLRFIQRYEQYKGGQQLARSMSPAGVEIYRRIEEGIAYLPAPVRSVRMRYLVNMVHGVLASAEHEIVTDELGYPDVGLIVANLIDMVVSAVSAPLSFETMTALDTAHAR